VINKHFEKNNRVKELGKPDDTTQKGINNITGGGKQTRIITFNNVKVGETTIYSTNVKEDLTNVPEQVKRQFLELLNSANQMQ
jgi:hypothetical protein